MKIKHSTIAFSIAFFALAVCYTPTGAATLCDQVKIIKTTQFIPGEVVILGELHGSNESPNFLRQLVCRELEQGKNVVVGIEADASLWDVEEPDGLGSLPKALESFAAHRFWNRPELSQDGRSSYAMWSLWTGLITQSFSDKSLSVVSIHPSARHSSISRFVSLMEKSNNAVGFILTGNRHARRGFQADLPESIAFFSSQKPSSLRVSTMLMGYSAGAVWNCTSSCGVRNVGLGILSDLDNGFYYFNQPKDAATLHELIDAAPYAKYYDGVFWLGTITPSLPYISRLSK